MGRKFGLSAAKGRISRQIGIPLTRSGRQKKAGRLLGSFFFPGSARAAHQPPPLPGSASNGTVRNGCLGFLLLLVVVPLCCNAITRLVSGLHLTNPPAAPQLTDDVQPPPAPTRTAPIISAPTPPSISTPAPAPAAATPATPHLAAPPDTRLAGDLIWDFVPHYYAQPQTPDTILTTSAGREIRGVITTQSNTSISILTRGGTLTLPADQVASTTHAAAAPFVPDQLPTWETFIIGADTPAWASALHQVPATVIDNGVMKNVPYLSYQAAGYELNLYGDPESPACIEAGVRGDLLTRDDAKANCLRFIATLLQNGEQLRALRSLHLAKDSKEIAGLTLEITPDTDPDAYGGWWISIYSNKRLDASRATPAEMIALTTPTPRPSLVNAPRAPLSAPLVTPYAQTDRPTPWTATDMRSARPSSGSRGGGSVYVSGYTRKNGTFVQAHTRAAPGFGHQK